MGDWLIGTGRLRRVCLEVVDRPSPGVLRIVSGLGPQSQWYRNLVADPRCVVSSGRLHRIPATAQVVPQDMVAAALERYSLRHPIGWRVLERAMRDHLPDGDSYGDFLPMVDIVLDLPAGIGANGA